MVNRQPLNLGELAFRAGRRLGKHPLAGRLFRLAEPILPLKRIARESGLVAFHHPRPIADPHVLVVPTRPVSSLTTPRLDEENMALLLWSMVEFAMRVTEHLAPADAWLLTFNGGSRQDIGQLHGHLLHTESRSGQARQVITNPETHLETWQAMLRELRAASADPGSGFSLEFSWHQKAEITVAVT